MFIVQRKVLRWIGYIIYSISHILAWISIIWGGILLSDYDNGLENNKLYFEVFIKFFVKNASNFSQFLHE